MELSFVREVLSGLIHLIGCAFIGCPKLECRKKEVNSFRGHFFCTSLYYTYIFAEARRRGVHLGVAHLGLDAVHHLRRRHVRHARVRPAAARAGRGRAPRRRHPHSLPNEVEGCATLMAAGDTRNLCRKSQVSSPHSEGRR